MLSWRVRRKRRQTSCNECWTLRLEWSPAQRSWSEACRGFFTLTCIGSMYQSESCTSSVSWCTAVYMVKRRSTCSTPANQSPMSRHGVISDLLVGDCWTYRTMAEYICPVDFLCGWSVGVELVAGLPERAGSQQRHFLQAPRDVFVCCVLIYV